MPAVETLNLLINAGIAGVFAVFAYILLKAFLEHLVNQDIRWIEYLKGEREQRRTAMEQGQAALAQINAVMSQISEKVASINVSVAEGRKENEDHARETSKRLEAISQATRPRQVQDRRSQDH